MDTPAQGDLYKMFDYLREDIKGLREDISQRIDRLEAKMDANRIEIRGEIKEFHSAFAEHTSSDTTNFKHIEERFDDVDKQVATNSAINATKHTIKESVGKKIAWALGWVTSVAMLITVILKK